MSAHDPFVEDFVWSMDDNRHTESKSRELTEGDVPELLLFADREVINTVRTTAAGSVAQVAGRDPSGARTFAEVEVKRHRQGLKRDEMGSSDVLDVTVFNLGNLARQTIQRQAEPRMLRLIMNQTSHIMMLVEGTSLAVNQWDKKLKEANWTLGSSDDHHHWVVREPPLMALQSRSSLTIAAVSIRRSGTPSSTSPWEMTSNGSQVWKGGQDVYRLMVVHVSAVARLPADPADQLC